MALADVVAVLRADTSQFSSKLGEAQTQVQKLSTEGSSNFNKMASIGKSALLGISAGLLAGGVAAVDFGNKLEDSQAGLQASLKAAGITWASVSGSVSATGSQMTKYGFTQAQVDDALSKGVISTQSYSKSHANLSVAVELAAAKHVDLNTAMTAVDKATQGNTKALMSMGISLPIVSTNALKLKQAQDGLSGAQLEALSYLQKYPDALDTASAHHAGYEAALDKVTTAQGKLKDQQSASGDILKALSDRLGGQATAAADTFSGRLDTAKAQGENLVAEIGMKLIPILEGLMTGIQNVVSWFDKHKTAAEVLGGVIAALVAGAIAVYIVNVGTNMVAATQRALTSLGLLGDTAVTTGGEMEAAGGKAAIAGGEMDAAGAASGEAGMAGGLAAGEGAATGLTGVLGPLGIAAGIVTLGAVALGNAISGASPKFIDMSNKAAGMSATTLPQMTLKMQALKDALDKSNGSMQQSGIVGDAARAAHQQLTAQIQTLQGQEATLTNNTSLLSTQFGINTQQAQAVAQSIGINLSGALTKGDVQAFKQQVDQMGLSLDSSGGKAQTASATVISAMSSAAAGAQNVLTATDWSAMGYNLISGVAAGMNENVGAVTTAAGTIVKAGLAAGNLTAVARSPSRLFADKLGAFIPQGIAAGMLEGTHYVTSAASALIYSAAGAGGSSMSAISGASPTITGSGSSFSGRGGGATIYNYITISNPDPQAVVNQLRTWMQRNGSLAGAGVA